MKNKPSPDSLLVVESPAKAHTISQFLNSTVQVKACKGHIRDLPEKRLGVNISANFQPIYVIPEGKKPIVEELRKALRDKKILYIATDEDREGEAIGWHLIIATGAGSKEVRRIAFHEITPEAVHQAFNNPRSINMNLVNAQQARRILDRLVGYKISPLLGRKVQKGLSAGRVQSVALRFIVEREEQIEKFVPQEYWTIVAWVRKREDTQSFSAQLVSIGGKKLDKFAFTTQKEAQEVVKGLEGKSFVVEKVEEKRRKQNPPPPFITSLLQQASFRRLGFSAQKTMRIAQQLYEGIDLGEKGRSGLITYMRTDSFHISPGFQREASRFIKEKFGSKYAPATPPLYRRKVRGAQEAHEAIRPTSIHNPPEVVESYLDRDQLALYTLIWKRFLASQMPPALYRTTKVLISANGHLFEAVGEEMLFDGFTRIYEEGEKREKLPPLKEGEALSLLKIDPLQHFTQPPPRYTEASLIKDLEKHGIGRPSTYAPIIQILKARDYVKIRKKRFYPQKKGILVYQLLKKHFPEIVDIKFTAKMEERLDQIARGDKSWQEVLAEFYLPFSQALEKAYKEMKFLKPPPIPTEEKCDKCGRPLVIREGRYGKFLACSGFPRCRNTKPLNSIPVENEGNGE